MYANLGHHGAIGCYDANLLAEIEKEIQIIIHVLYVWHASMQVKDFHMH